MLGDVPRRRMRSVPVLIIGALMVVSTVQLECDPMTQIRKGGQCCKMCGPGTSMATDGTCENPKCEPCRDGEYQDKYTVEPKCSLQPYCDPNKNKEPAGPPIKTKKIDCVCKTGYHCNNCVICSKHTDCGPGMEVEFEGNQTSDTVCRDCPEGTFSNVTSWSSKCIKYTECEPGFHVETKGTARSDNICVQTPRTHSYIWISLLTLALGALSLGALYWLCRRSQRIVKHPMKQILSNDDHPHCEDEHNKNDACILIDAKPCESDTFLPEQESTQDESNPHILTPEENLDEESQETVNFTDNGNYVRQENGKSEILSRQESRTCAFVDSL